MGLNGSVFIESIQVQGIARNSKNTRKSRKARKPIRTAAGKAEQTEARKLGSQKIHKL